MKPRRNLSVFFAAMLIAAMTTVGCSKSSTDNQDQDQDKTTSAQGGKSDAKKGGSRGSKGAEEKPAAPQPVVVTIPAGTTIPVVMGQALSSATNNTGDQFQGTLAAPIMVDGKTALPKGANVSGSVTNAKKSGRLSTPGELGFGIDSIQANGTTYNVSVTPISMKAGSHKNRDLAIIGGSGAGGALIGGLLGGGKGAAIGALAGGGGGTAGAMLTGKKDISVNAESRVNFALTQPVTVTLAPSAANAPAAGGTQ